MTVPKEPLKVFRLLPLSGKAATVRILPHRIVIEEKYDPIGDVYLDKPFSEFCQVAGA